MGSCCASENKVSDETKSLIAADKSFTNQSFDTVTIPSVSTNDITMDGIDNVQIHDERTQSDDIHNENEPIEIDHNQNASGQRRFPPQLHLNDNNALSILNETTSNENTKDVVRIQIEQLPEFHEEKPWILDVNRKKESPASLAPSVKAYSYTKDQMSRRRVTLTDSHNFLWFTLIIEGALKSAELESEITRTALDRVLNLTPVPYRDKIWEICNIENDSYIVYEEFEEFVDSLMIATGQFEVKKCSIWELRDMSKVFKKIVSTTEIFSDNNCVALNEKKCLGLATHGATKVVMLLRNLKKANDIPPNDIAIVLLTGFTRKAIRHSIKYCTRIFWKILTDVWWKEEDSEDMALPMDIEQYDKRKKHSRKKSNMSQDLKRHLSSTSMEELFGSNSEDEWNINENDKSKLDL